MRKNDAQVCLKLSGPLRGQLETEAAVCGRSLSNLIRQILIEHTARRMTAGAGSDTTMVAH
jgi:hypothetical protein